MISIGFSTKKDNLISLIIRDVTKGKFSHCWIRYYHPLMQGDVVIDADLRGVVEVPYAPYVAQLNGVVELVPPVGVDLMAAMPAMLVSLGDDYDVASLFGRLWVYFCRWLGKKVKNPLGNPNKDCCVESVVRLLKPAAVLPASTDGEVEDPQDVYDKLIAAGWTPRTT